MQFSEVFKYLCKEAGVTQRQALAEMKLGRNSAQRWTDSWPSFEALSKISNYLMGKLYCHKTIDITGFSLHCVY